MGALTKELLETEAKKATKLLSGKIIKVLWRQRDKEIVIEFTDGTRLFIDHQPDRLELSITGL